MTVIFGFDGDLKLLADAVERVRHTEVLSLGRSLEIVKDLGDAETVSAEYGLGDYIGTHAIGHARMATESDVDIANAHPYWAYPFPDVAVVHNGQLTNFHDWRRRLQRSGHRFQSECDSEIIAVYLAEQMSEGRSLEEAMRQSLEDLDGVFTYICVTEDALGVAKDELGAKPLVLYEDDELVALASEEIAIRQVLDREIETHDPYEGEVRVWTQVSEREPHRGWTSAGWSSSTTRSRRPRRSTASSAELDAARADHAQDQRRAALADLRAGRQGGHRAQPQRPALARGRDPGPLPDPLRGQPRLLRLRPDRRPRGRDHRPGRLVGGREHDVGRRRGREQRRLAGRRGAARRRPRRQGRRRRPHRDRPEGRHDHRRSATPPR